MKIKRKKILVPKWGQIFTVHVMQSVNFFLPYFSLFFISCLDKKKSHLVTITNIYM